MSNREAGYYWTKVDGEWEPAFHQGDGDWRIFGGWAEDDWFEEIGPRIPAPDEPWQAVPKEPTTEMSCAAVDTFREMLSAPSIYAAMLATAPKP
nr:hypothetical protein [Halomonas socia]